MQSRLNSKLVLNKNILEDHTSLFKISTSNEEVIGKRSLLKECSRRELSKFSKGHSDTNHSGSNNSNKNRFQNMYKYQSKSPMQSSE